MSSYSAFFQPPDAWVGDVIPVEADGVLWLFYLLERREEPKPGTPWSLVATKDLVHFDDRGIVFAHGSPDEPDFNVYTGSIARDGAGKFHLFYTAQNPWRLGADEQPLQVIRRATSIDGMTSWTRDAAWELVPPNGFETADWRDPFVFRDDRTGLWRMLVAARNTTGPARRRGTIAQFTSVDLADWSPTTPFWDPQRYVMHECPEVFAWGDWWYLVYSEFSENFTTRYRMAHSPDGPWLVPERDSIDGRAFYAAKSVALDDRRLFVGWIASKQDGRDAGAWQWAGTMSILAARQNPDGTLAFAIPDEVVESFDTPLAVPPIDPAVLDAPDGYGVVVSAEPAPETFYLRARLDIAPGTSETGLLLRASDDGDAAYIIRLEPGRQRMTFDRWPRAVTGPMQWQISGDVPFELERPCDLAPGEHTLEVLVDADVVVAVIDRQVALSARMYDRTVGHLGLFVGEGRTCLRELTVHVRPTPQPIPLLPSQAGEATFSTGSVLQ